MVAFFSWMGKEEASGPMLSAAAFRIRLGTLIRAGAIQYSFSRMVNAFLTVSRPTDNLLPSSRSPGNT